MKQLHKIFLTAFLVLSSSSLLLAQKSFFSDISESSIRTGFKRVITPQKYRVTTADLPQLKNFLWSLPMEKDVIYNRRNTPILELPMPDGQLAKFHVWQSSIQEAGLEAKFPTIRTFAGQGIDDPYATIRFDVTEFGFHAQVLSAVKGRVYIDPYARGDVNNYISYYSVDNVREAHFVCEVQDNPVTARPSSVAAGPCRGTQLYTYRLAVACTGEYAVAVGGTTAALLHSAIVTTVNRVDGVYENEVSVRLVLIANNNLIEFLLAGSDPFNGNNNAGTLITESQSVITSNIGAANFDIGHTFSTGGGGLAGLGVVCNNSQKARGITGSPNPVGDDYDIDYVAHEMGHQFGGNHTFNSTTSNCGGGNRNASTAYEVGSGTTIQAYAGICTTDDIQLHSDPFFHTVSFDEISNYIEAGGASCRVATATGNTLPQITTMDNNNINIPFGTPFTLTGSATDADGDAITYCWEEWDLGTGGAWNNGAASTTAPLFKSRIPKGVGYRTFPDSARIIANYLPATPGAVMGGLKGETLPTVARALKFRLTVRDNRAGGGGVVTGGSGCQAGFTGTFQVNVANAGPFAVTVPNGGESWAGASTQTVTWNVNGTDAAPISTANVKITLSIDGGLTYPTVVLASTANDGSESITVPGTPTTTARMRIEAVGNIYFDISNANFTITAPPTGFTFDANSGGSVTCGGAATSTVTQGTTSQGGFNTPINLTASGNPAGTTVSFGTNPVTPGSSSTVTLNNTNTLAPGTYNVTVTGTAGTTTQTTTIAFVVAPGTPPSITAQPTNVTACAGSTATFSVSTSTAGASFQWQVSTNGGATWTDIAGATGSGYSINTVAGSDNNNQYHAVITTTCASATSNAATLTVNTAPAISAQPTNASLCAGDNVTFCATATGSGLTYVWEVSTDGGTVFNVIPGATANCFTINGITAGLNGNIYHVIVSGACNPAVTSANASLSVGTPPSITTQPLTQTVCEGTAVSFSVTSPSPGLTYQWQVSTNGGTSYANITGETTSTLSIASAATTQSGNLYQVIVTSSCASSTSTAATLTVNDAANITTQPAGASVCVGSDATISVTATGPGLTYQWQISTDGGATYTDMAGETGSNLDLTGVTSSMDNNMYHVIVTGTTCGSVTSGGATLNVNAVPTVTITADTTVNTPGTNATLTATSNPSASTYAWLQNGSPVAGQNGSSINVAYGSEGTYTAVVVDVNGCSNVSNAIVIRDTIIVHTFIYPNPNSGHFWVTFEGVPYNNLPRFITMYDAKGARVYQKDYRNITSSYQPLEVRVEKFARGMYTLVLSDAIGTTLGVGKVIIR